MRTTLITHALRYFGPDAVIALAGDRLLLHDASFGDPQVREAFAAEHPHAVLLAGQTPEAAVTEAANHCQRLDVLFCNHFRPPPRGSLADTDADTLRGLLEALTVEPYRFVRAALPLLGPSQVVITTSAAGQRPGKGASLLYAAARSAANTLVAGLAKELGPREIGVTGLAPNYYASADTYSQAAFETNERVRAHVERHVPLQRLSHPREAQRTIAYLCSEDARFISGQVVHFTGGWL